MSIKEANGIFVVNLKRHIENAGLKISFVADKAELTLQELSDILNGRRLIKAVEISRIIKVLNIDANLLFQE